MRRALLLILCIATQPLGCHRTHYVNLQPPPDSAPSPLAASRAAASGWQHFFIWGWVPRMRTYDIAEICGRGGRVSEIRTQQRFTQGLVAILASYYVNIYSPYDAEFFCASAPPPDDAPATAAPAD